MHQQETDHSVGLNGTNSNTSFINQDHSPKVYMSLYMYATLLKFSAPYIAIRRPFSLGLSAVVCRNKPTEVVQLRDVVLKETAVCQQGKVLKFFKM